MRETDITQDLLPRHRHALRCLAMLGRTVKTDSWCLVGGLMVLVAARAAGRRHPRAEGTKDSDIVVDVVADTTALANMTHVLTSLGYRLPYSEDRGADFARCTFSDDSTQIDVLAPDDTPADLLDVDGGLRSLAIPGGRRALVGAELMRILYDEEMPDAVIRVPPLPAAICVKAAAALDPRTSNQPRHRQDVAYLLSCVDDPIAALGQLNDSDTALLRQLAATGFTGPGGWTWQYLDSDQIARARAALRILVT